VTNPPFGLTKIAAAIKRWVIAEQFTRLAARTA
jgi:hypothetical protein